MRSIFKGLVFGLASLGTLAGPALAVEVNDVLKTYADIAQATYSDSLQTARKMQDEITSFVENPTDESLGKAREAWIAARVPYQQSEVFRFGNPLVDEWEGKVNAWPLDEGLIDYVDDKTYGTMSDENALYTANIIANTKLSIGDETVDAAEITPALLESLQEAGDIETNVTTGYHAIEFLLWGQDLNGTGPGAGDRKASDYHLENCTNGNCDRRGAYLKAATTLLISDLEYMVEAWGPDGEARLAVINAAPEQGLKAILTGMGSLSYGELAGERMKLGLMLHDPEEEHDCFSDNTHASHFNDARGIANVYLGTYTTVDGKEVKGASVSELVAAKDAAVDADLKAKLAVTLAAMQVIVDRAAKGEHYDQLISAENTMGNAIVSAAITALLNQTKAIEGAVKVLGLDSVDFEGSESLDNPATVDK